MSADNWATCPRCLDRAKAASAAKFKEAMDAYGKVPVAEFEALRAEAQTPVDEAAFETFREDYEFYGAIDGTVTASYSGNCQVCGLSVDFKHEHPFYERQPEPARDARSPGEMKLLLVHERGQLGPKTVEEWSRPNGDDCLLVFMLKELEGAGQRRVELLSVVGDLPGYEELRP